MNHPMPNPLDEVDQQIDRTLTALGQVEPASNFHDRLLRGLDGRAEAAPYGVALQGPGNYRPGREALSVLQWWRRHGFATTVVVASVALLVLLSHQAMRRTTPRLQTPQSGAAEAPGAGNLPLLTAPRGSAIFSARSTPLRAGALPPALIAAEHVALAKPAIHFAATLEVSLTAPANPDQQALADFLAPSQPAPPLPLTSQERLVRLMLRHGEQVQLAKLDLARDPELQRAEIAAFRNFFDPPSSTPEDPATSPDKSSQDQPITSPKP